MVRPASVDSNGLKKGAWSEEEDNKLRAYIKRYGHWNWRLLPKYAGLARCGKSCRLRWVNYLKPGIKKGNFSQDEKDLIVKLHARLGNKWSAIAAYLPGRTDNEIKNFWNTRRKKSGLNENPTTNNVNNGCSASSRDQALGKEKTSETTICITTRNESPSTSENPKPLSENTHPSDLNADFQVDFWQDTAYTQNDYFPPLPEEEFSYSQLHYSELSSSNSCYPNRIEVDDLSALFCDYATQPLQEDFWSESLVSNTSNSVSENCCNNWTQEVGGFYDPFLQFYDPF